MDVDQVICTWGHLKVIFVAGTYMAIAWLIICCFFSVMCTPCGFYIRSIAAVQRNIHVACGRYICSWAYVSNEKCTSTNAPGGTLDCR